MAYNLRMTAKKILIGLIAVVALAIAFNYFAGTTIIVNGKQITGVGNYIAAFVAMIVFAALLIFVIPSAIVLVVVLFMIFGIFSIVFFPVLPFAFLLLPGIVFAGVIYLLYRIIRKK